MHPIFYLFEGDYRVESFVMYCVWATESRGFLARVQGLPCKMHRLERWPTWRVVGA